MKAKILVVDDEANIRTTLEEILRLEGYDVFVVESGDVATELLSKESIDLMLLDLNMPGMDGNELLKVKNRISQDTIVIVLTGHGSLETAIEALRQGAHDYLLKPATAAQILISVNRGLGKKVEQQRRRLLLEQIDTSIQRLKDAEGINTHTRIDQQTVTIGDGIMVDLSRREIWRGNVRISLTPTEGKTMRVLLDNRGRVLTHRELVLMVQGYDISDWEAPEVLRPLISRLRRKLSSFPGGENWIANVRGTGYVFEPGESDELS